MMFNDGCRDIKAQLRNVHRTVCGLTSLSPGALPLSEQSPRDYLTINQHDIKTQIQLVLTTMFVPAFTAIVQLKPKESTFATEMVHLSLRTIQSELILSPTDSSSDRITELFILLDIILCLAELECTEQTSPLLIMEDILDSLTVSKTVLIIDFLQDRLDRLVVNLQPNKGKGLVFLRFCNELMRRLSKVKNVVFCGRILILLASVFSLNERSGVNLRGDFHVENVTMYEMETDMQLDDATSKEAGKDNQQTELYNHVWGIQKHFSQPTLLFADDEFNLFKTHAEAIKLSFEKLNLVESESSQSKKIKSKNSQYKKSSFFPKYLSGRNLFDLELRDAAFRTQIILQNLIIFHFLNSLAPIEKENAHRYIENKGNASKENKSILYPYTLTKEQEIWVIECRAKFLSVLERTAPHGKIFARATIAVLQQEKKWMLWKLNNCQKFELERSALPDGEPATFPGSLVARLGTRYLGNDDMTRLWRNGKDLDAKLKSRSVPAKTLDLEEFLTELNDQIDKDGNIEEGVEDEYLHHKDELYNWRAYRIAMRHHIHLMQNADDSVNAKNLLMEWRKGQEDESQHKERSDVGMERVDSLLSITDSSIGDLVMDEIMMSVEKIIEQDVEKSGVNASVKRGQRDIEMEHGDEEAKRIKMDIQTTIEDHVD